MTSGDIAMMRAVSVRNGTGDADALFVERRPRPELQPGQVLIRVRAAGVNRPDILQRQGLYPPPPGASEVLGLKAYKSVDDLPEPVDLAILIIPAQFVPAELERCGKAGIKAAVILSSGFAEEPGEA